MQTKTTLLFTMFWLFVAMAVYAGRPVNDPLIKILAKQDISTLWYNKTNDAGTNPSNLPEPLGFIGIGYQRFYIHYISVVKSKSDPYLYEVTGKTKVKDNTCAFSGTIRLVKAAFNQMQNDSQVRKGFLETEILLQEDSNQRGSGFFIGYMTTAFYTDQKGNVHYDDLEFGADAFYNNQCEAKWTSYQSYQSKKCNWGDYRIPAAKALDTGDGEFAVSKKYLEHGWENYMLAWSGDPERPGVKGAQEKELQHWWALP